LTGHLNRPAWPSNRLGAPGLPGAAVGVFNTSKNPCPNVPRREQKDTWTNAPVLFHDSRSVEEARKGRIMKKQGKVQLAVPVTAAEKATMAAMARREGKSLTAWAAGAIRAAWLRRDR